MAGGETALAGIPVIARLAARNVLHKPGRTAFLLLGYGIGVGVMIVLLSIGEALLAQARDEKLVGGGDVTVLPEGVDVEVMKTGGLGGMFFSIDHARFVYRQLLAAPRQRDVIAAVAPQLEGKLIYLRAGDREWPVRATGEIPDATVAVGAPPAIVSGEWANDEGDRRWIAPTPFELRHEIDHFHLPPPAIEHRSSWGEWHYFNVLSADERRWAFLSFIVGGEVPDGQWGGQVAITLRERGGRARRFVAVSPASGVRLSTISADLTIGDATVTVAGDGRYTVHAVAREAGGSATLKVDLVIAPDEGAYFPGASLGDDGFVSGYVVPALRATATGRICVDAECERYAAAPAYHDHNWGVWRGVTWEWGSARAGSWALLYGRVHPPDESTSSAIGDTPPFLYLVDSLGFRAVFRPSRIVYDDSRTLRTGVQAIRVPARAVLEDARGADSVRVEIEVLDAIATDMRASMLERGDPAPAGFLRRPWFIQMQGRARLTGRIGGEMVDVSGPGFFETYR